MLFGCKDLGISVCGYSHSLTHHSRTTRHCTADESCWNIAMYVCMLVVRDLLVFWYGILICCWTYVFGCKWVHSLTHSRITLCISQWNVGKPTPHHPTSGRAGSAKPLMSPLGGQASLPPTLGPSPCCTSVCAVWVATADCSGLGGC